jgi:hypothetical protein
VILFCLGYIILNIVLKRRRRFCCESLVGILFYRFHARRGRRLREILIFLHNIRIGAGHIRAATIAIIDPIRFYTIVGKEARPLLRFSIASGVYSRCSNGPVHGFAMPRKASFVGPHATWATKTFCSSYLSSWAIIDASLEVVMMRMSLLRVSRSQRPAVTTSDRFQSRGFQSHVELIETKQHCLCSLLTLTFKPMKLLL